jgi:hypothetical protein
MPLYAICGSSCSNRTNAINEITVHTRQAKKTTLKGKRKVKLYKHEALISP